MLQGYVSSRSCDHVSALVRNADRLALNEREAAFAKLVAKGVPIGTAALHVGYAQETTGHQAMYRPHVVAAIHMEVQRLLVAECAPASLKVLTDIQKDPAAPARVRADISTTLMKMAGHVQPTNRDREPEKQLSEMSREEMIAYIDRNQAEIDKAVDELASRAKDVSAQHGDQYQTDPAPKPLPFLD